MEKWFEYLEGILSADAEVFGRFRLEHALWHTETGVFWLAREHATGHPVTVQFLPDCYLIDENARWEIELAADTTKGLKHPNILPVLDFCHDTHNAAVIHAGAPAQTMSDLQQKQRHGIFECDQLGIWCRELCDALHYAHTSKNVFHLDLNPGNLWLTRENVLQVAAFATSRKIKSRLMTNLEGEPPRPLIAYQSPQQLKGEPPAAADDIYGAGVLLYELITGTPPFHSGDIAGQIENDTPRRMTEWRMFQGIHDDPVPESWEKAAAACLAKDPADRPESAEVIGAAIGTPRERTPHTEKAEKRESPPPEPLAIPAAQTPQPQKKAAPKPEKTVPHTVSKESRPPEKEPVPEVVKSKTPAAGRRPPPEETRRSARRSKPKKKVKRKVAKKKTVKKKHLSPSQKAIEESANESLKNKKLSILFAITVLAIAGSVAAYVLYFADK